MKLNQNFKRGGERDFKLKAFHGKDIDYFHCDAIEKKIENHLEEEAKKL